MTNYTVTQNGDTFEFQFPEHKTDEDDAVVVVVGWKNNPTDAELDDKASNLENSFYL